MKEEISPISSTPIDDYYFLLPDSTTGNSFCELTKQIEQVRSISSLTESNKAHVSDGLPPSNVSEHSSNGPRTNLFSLLFSLRLM